MTPVVLFFSLFWYIRQLLRPYENFWKITLDILKGKTWGKLKIQIFKSSFVLNSYEQLVYFLLLIVL